MTDAARAKDTPDLSPIGALAAKWAHPNAWEEFRRDVNAYAAVCSAALRTALSESVRIFEEAYGDDSDAALVPSAREAEWYRKSRSLLADPEGQRAGEEQKAWAVKLVCCGRDAGEWRCATWEDADALRNSYVSAEGHERVGIIVAAVERARLP